MAWFPTGGFESSDDTARTVLEQLGDVVWHLVMPMITYTSVSLATLSRYARTGVIDVIRADYIRTARAKGLHEFVVIMKHAVRNGMIPILTLLGGLLPEPHALAEIVRAEFDHHRVRVAVNDLPMAGLDRWPFRHGAKHGASARCGNTCASCS